MSQRVQPLLLRGDAVWLRRLAAAPRQLRFDSRVGSSDFFQKTTSPAPLLWPESPVLYRPRPTVDRSEPVLEEVKEQERKLLHMHYEERISGELFDEEQTRIRERRKDAEELIARLSVRYEDIAVTLALALEILGEDLHELYRRADDTIRRLINQAIFNALFVCDETITEAELAEPFAALRALHDAIRGLPASAGPLAERRRRRQRCPEDAKGPDPCRGRDPFRVGSISEVLVCPSGLEPPRTVKSTRPSTLFARAIYVRRRPDRPIRPGLRTHRTHRTT